MWEDSIECKCDKIFFTTHLVRGIRMEVKKNMIDSELRLRGQLLDLFFSKSSEEKFLKSMHRIKKMSDRLEGSKVSRLKAIEKWIERKDGSKLRLCIYKPQNINENKKVPGVLWSHGGGYALGIPEFFAATYKQLLEARDCVIVAPDYRLSIEEPYPAALEDVYTTLLWLKNNAEELGIRSNQLMVGGESAGGGLTAALTHLARDRGEVNIAFQMPLYPMIDDRMQLESAQDNNAPIWNSRTNRWAWNLYLRELEEESVPSYAAAARATDYSGLPPAVTYVGEVEPFKDEVTVYVKNLRQAGIPVAFEIYEGAYHGFPKVNPQAKVSKSANHFFTEAFEYAVDHYFAEQI